MSYEDLEKDQQEILEKSDINTLANYCQELRTYEDEIEELEQQIKSKKEKADTKTINRLLGLTAYNGLVALVKILPSLSKSRPLSKIFF